MTAKKFEVDDKCDVCESKIWVGTSDDITKYFIIAGSHRGSSLVTIEYRKNRYLVGIGCNGSHICLRCFEMLLGMENYFDAFYYQFYDNEEVKNKIKKIYSNDKLLDEAISYRQKGKYIPNEFIKTL